MDPKLTIPTTDPATVAANRQGKLTDAQRTEIVRSADPRIWVIGGVIVIVLIVVSLLCFSTMDAGGVAGILAPIFGLVLLFVLWRGIRIGLLRKRLLSGAIQSAQGRVTFHPATLVDPGKYVAETDDGKKLYNNGLAGMGVALLPGRYTFFYLQAQSWILSAEAISSPEELLANHQQDLYEAFHFDAAGLERLRREAAAGTIQMVETAIENTTVTNHVTDPGDSSKSLDVSVPHVKFGNLQFPVPDSAGGIALSCLNYRIYHNNESILALEALS